MKVVSQLAPVARDVLVNSIINGRLILRRIRGALLNLTGQRIHRSVTICADGFLGSNEGLTVGKGSFINYGCFFDLGAPTTIGEGVSIGYQVMFVTCSHHSGASSRRAGMSYAEPISIGDGSWIGARAIILPGVRIGGGVIVGAGSVVTSDCEPNALYAGSPARKVKSLKGIPDAELDDLTRVHA